MVIVNFWASWWLFGNRASNINDLNVDRVLPKDKVTIGAPGGMAGTARSFTLRGSDR